MNALKITIRRNWLSKTFTQSSPYSSLWPYTSWLVDVDSFQGSLSPQWGIIQETLHFYQIYLTATDLAWVYILYMFHILNTITQYTSLTVPGMSKHTVILNWAQFNGVSFKFDLSAFQGGNSNSLYNQIQANVCHEMKPDFFVKLTLHSKKVKFRG